MQTSSHHATARRRALTLALVVAGILVVPATRGQGRRAIEDLNIRWETEHYVLAGTVLDSVLQDYAAALEYIYDEYAWGFQEILKAQEKKDADPAPDDAKADEDPDAKQSKKKRAKKSAAARKKKGKGGGAVALGRRLGDEDPARKFRVLIFGTREDYRQFGRTFLTGGTEHTGGMYVPRFKALLILDQGNIDDTASILFHEAFHQFMDRYVQDPPMWLNEGLAVYYGTARPTRQGLVFDRPETDYWKIVRKLINKNRPIPLWEVVSANRRQFYDSTPLGLSGRYRKLRYRTAYYAEAYTLVHLLLDDPTARERLRNYLRDLARDDGQHTGGITRKYFGPDVCEHMTPFWIEHVQSRPENR